MLYKAWGSVYRSTSFLVTYKGFITDGEWPRKPFFQNYTFAATFMFYSLEEAGQNASLTPKTLFS